ncbi:MAG: response regulator [Solirubrobacterales bacterium]|nr:response regulator [Solirubrobacterales bacterium]
MSVFHSSSILLVEDNLLDVRLTVELLREAKLANRLKVISDGSEAITSLTAALASGEALPDLVLLDLDLPGAGGRQVLETIRGTPGLGHLAVFILTSSPTQRDIVQDEKLRANGYLEKPIDLSEFIRVVTAQERFWLELVSAPLR